MLMRFYISSVLVFAVASASAAEQAAISADLDRCARISDDSARLKCFDAIAAKESNAAPESTQAAVSPSVATGAQTVPPLTDEVGKERVKTSEPRPKQEYAGTVTRCEESRLAAGRYFFYLENGQVWKQTDSRRRSWRDCQFAVTIGKDALGYKMRVPDRDRTVRVTRVR